MVLDSSVMNVSMATVAKDLGTTITGIQTAITLYTLVMASLMITGGKLGQILGRKRAFAIGCVIYGCGSFITAISPSLPVLLIGWSGLEGVGAALILPAIVALVASNFGREQRPRSYGLVASAGAIAVAVGPIVGGLFTTYLSWRWVFAGEVLIVFPNRVKSQATTQLAGGAPFISDAQLKTALNDAHVPTKTADAIVQENATARIDALRTALSVLAIFALVALFLTGAIPKQQPATGAEQSPSETEQPALVPAT